MASFIALAVACGGVVDLKTEGTAGGPSNGGDDAAGDGPFGSAGVVNHGGSLTTGGKSSMGGTPSTAGALTTAGAPSMGGTPILSFAGTPSTAGTGGMPACMPKAGPKSGDGIDTDIDDIDDDNNTFLTAGVGQGLWDFSKDVSDGVIEPQGTATLVPVAGGVTGKALHLKGYDLTGWGAALSAILDGSQSWFDASKYGGIAFYMKGTSHVVEGENKVMILARMPETLPGPGSCCVDSIVGQECYASHRIVIDVPEDWKEVKIGWSDFYNANWGYGAFVAFNPNRLRDIVFGFNREFSLGESADPISFDVWVDGMRFLEKDELGNVNPEPNGGTGGMPGTSGTAGTGGTKNASEGGAGGEAP